MTKRRERDPTRIAQLLASEVTGRSAGPLGRLAVVDAEPEASPSADGSLAYRLALAAAENDGGRSARERAGGASRLIGAVHLHREAAVVSLPAAGRDPRAIDLPDRVLAAGERATSGARDNVSVARDGGRLTVEIRTGAAVKPAVDVLTALADSAGSDPARDDAPPR